MSPQLRGAVLRVLALRGEVRERNTIKEGRVHEQSEGAQRVGVVRGIVKGSARQWWPNSRSPAAGGERKA